MLDLSRGCFARVRRMAMCVPPVVAAVVVTGGRDGVCGGVRVSVVVTGDGLLSRSLEGGLVPLVIACGGVGRDCCARPCRVGEIV